MNVILSRLCPRPRLENACSVVIPLVLAFSLLLTVGLVAQTALRTPEQAFGFRVGSDRQLVNWTQLTGYLTELSKASDKLRIVDIGRTTMGKPLIAAVVSSKDNIARLDRYREIVRELADPRATPPEAAARLASEGKVIIAIGCSNHAAELGAAQMSAELVHYLVTDDSPRTRRILDDVVGLLRRERGQHFDPACVNALLHRLDDALEIQNQHAEFADFVQGKATPKLKGAAGG